MSDPIYGDRRCLTCMTVRARQEDPCWYCARKMPTEDDVATAMANTIAKEVDDRLLKHALEQLSVPTGPFVPGKYEGTLELQTLEEPPVVPVFRRPGDALKDLKINIVGDSRMEPGTFKLVQADPVALRNLAASQRLTGGPISGRMASLEQMEAVMQRVRSSLVFDNVHGDAVQLARWLEDALQEIADLRAHNDRLVSRIDALHQTDPGR